MGKGERQRGKKSEYKRSEENIKWKGMQCFKDKYHNRGQIFNDLLYLE